MVRATCARGHAFAVAAGGPSAPLPPAALPPTPLPAALAELAGAAVWWSQGIGLHWETCFPCMCWLLSQLVSLAGRAPLAFPRCRWPQPRPHPWSPLGSTGRQRAAVLRSLTCVASVLSHGSSGHHPSHCPSQSTGSFSKIQRLARSSGG